MDYQELFYFLGSIYMLLGIIFLIVMLVVTFYLIKKYQELHEVIKEKTAKIAMDIRDVKEEITHQPSILMRYAGHLIVRGIKNYFTSHSEKSKR